MKPRDDDLVVPLGDDCATALALRDLQLRGDLGHLQARSTTEKIRKKFGHRVLLLKNQN